MTVATESYRDPILDFRALWSLSCAVPKKDYDFELWWAYARELSENAVLRSLHTSPALAIDRHELSHCRDNF